MNDNTPANDELFRRMWAIEQAVMLVCAVLKADAELEPKAITDLVRDLALTLENSIDRGERIPQSNVQASKQRGLGFSGQ